LYKIPKLSELLLSDSLLVEIKKWYKPDFIILDGSPLLNLTAWAILYKEKYFNEGMCLKAIKILSDKEEIKKDDIIYKEFPELSSIKRLGLNHLKIPNIVVFLNVEPNIAIDRIRQRGEDRQAHETGDKLSKLSNAYHMTCNVIKRDLDIPTHIINGDDGIDNTTSAIFGYIDKCLKGELSCERPKD